MASRAQQTVRFDAVQQMSQVTDYTYFALHSDSKN